MNLTLLCSVLLYGMGKTKNEIVDVEEIGRRYQIRYAAGKGGYRLTPENHFSIALLYIATGQVIYNPKTMKFSIPPFSSLHSNNFQS